MIRENLPALTQEESVSLGDLYERYMLRWAEWPGPDEWLTPDQKIAFAEDRAVFDGYAAAQITGVRQASSNPTLTLPGEVRDYPEVVSKALSQLRLAGVAGPYSLLLSADAYTAVSETSDQVTANTPMTMIASWIVANAAPGAYRMSNRNARYSMIRKIA